MTLDTRLFQLDGWRGISIACVLSAHLLPLGPASWQLNATAGALGMSLFFTLSGFLIASILQERPRCIPFLIRRCFRILPLAWLFMVLTLAVHACPIEDWFANAFFYLNYTLLLKPFNSHIWSLCVEMHFYFFVALLIALCGRNGLYLLPALCFVVTLLRMSCGAYASIATHLRVDEILVGASLAIFLRAMSEPPLRRLATISPWIALAFLIIASSPFCGPLQYVRPYAGGMAVGSTILSSEHPFSQLLKNKLLLYLATVSYALYVIHGPFRTGLFAGESTFDRYLIKRPVGIATTFVLAHFSTFYYEAYWIRLGKRLTQNRGTTDFDTKKSG